MKKNILLVDDDLDEIELLKEVVSEIDPDMKCEYAVNGEEAISLLENGLVSMPDLILLDINMPIMNGWEFLRKIKSTEHLKGIPVIVYTTSNRDHDRSMANKLGAQFFIKKPDDYRLLKKELGSVLKYGKPILLNFVADLHRTTLLCITYLKRGLRYQFYAGSRI
jgi:CheY-like chemotaxis protein